MRRLLLVVALGACSHPQARGPAWPKDHTADTDGGESLAPHESRQLAVAIEKSDDDEDKPVAKPAAAPVVAPVVEGVAPVAAPVPSAPIEETITSEDIVIEIDD